MTVDDSIRFSKFNYVLLVGECKLSSVDFKRYCWLILSWIAIYNERLSKDYIIASNLINKAPYFVPHNFFPMLQ